MKTLSHCFFKNRAFGFLVVLLGFNHPFHCLASRTLVAPPVQLFTVAGDMVCSNPAGEANPVNCLTALPCVTADVKGNEILGGGVLAIVHLYDIRISNVSTISQTVTVKVENLRLSYAVSDPPLGSMTPNLTKTTTALPVKSETFTVAPKGTASARYFVICNDGKCVSNINGVAPPASARYVCQEALSNIRVTFTVNEDRGAIQATISTAAHRNSGISDHFFSAPGTVLVNGGRAF